MRTSLLFSSACFRNLFREHLARSEKQILRRRVIVLDQDRDPEDFEIPAIQIFALCVQIPFVDLELIAERVDRLDLL